MTRATVLAVAFLAGAQLLGAQISRPSTGGRGVVGAGGCPLAMEAWWRAHGKGGKIACAADPARPAILLVHGLHQDMRTWTAPSFSEYAYDLRTPPDQRIEDTQALPNAGVFKVGKSDWLYGNDRAGWDREKNWFDYLRSQGFTVATWGQEGLSFAAAEPSGLAAFDSLLVQTAALSPGAPPPVALVGHSRGGLLIRKILKLRGTNDRVRWVVTLHSPHKGSELGKDPGRLAKEAADAIDCCVPSTLTPAFKQALRDVVNEAMRPWTNPESLELAPDGALIRGLAGGESALAGVKYYTFGGVKPNIYRLYTWLFDANSAKPQYRCENNLDPTSCKQYFVWRVKAHEIASISPMLEIVRDFVPEVKPNYGDALVTDASARLPWSTHVTAQLNHAEVLWDRATQARVARLIVPDSKTTRPNPSTEGMKREE